MGLGIAVAFALLTLGGAVVMLFARGQLTKGWGFAAAIVAASLSVAAVHAYG